MKSNIVIENESTISKRKSMRFIIDCQKNQEDFSTIRNLVKFIITCKKNNKTPEVDYLSDLDGKMYIIFDIRDDIEKIDDIDKEFKESIGLDDRN